MSVLYARNPSCAIWHGGSELARSFRRLGATQSTSRRQSSQNVKVVAMHLESRRRPAAIRRNRMAWESCAAPEGLQKCGGDGATSARGEKKQFEVAHLYISRRRRRRNLAKWRPVSTNGHRQLLARLPPLQRARAATLARGIGEIMRA